MAVEIKSENIDISGASILLVSVRDGGSVIGTCSAGYSPRSNDASSVNRLFYIGSDPVVNMVCPNHGNKRTDKLVSLCSGFQGAEKSIRDALTDSFQKINRGDSLEIGMRDVFALLADGVYTVYLSEYYPTDGSGTFFWGAYNISHEVHGTAEYNRTIGMNRPYRPCFLIPSEPLDMFAAKMKNTTDEAVKSRRVQGIAYHLSGLHSVLLKGHHGASSCIDHGIPFMCAVIEKITEPYTDPVAEPAAEGEEPVQREGISGFRSASVKIPLELFPKDMLRQIIESRSEYKPEHYSVLLRNMNVVRRKSVTNKVIPRDVLEKCDQMPDCEMVESAFALDRLTDDQLNALLAGETEHDGEIIISPNFYSSIVTACNYLQFHDERRFIDFAVAILENPELYATHEYTARRISRLNANKQVYGYFKSVIQSSEARYEKILGIAERYVRLYDAAN